MNDEPGARSAAVASAAYSEMICRNSDPRDDSDGTVESHPALVIRCHDPAMGQNHRGVDTARRGRKCELYPAVACDEQRAIESPGAVARHAIIARADTLVSSPTMLEADLFAAMRAAPDDEAPRLVYADWLLAHGDPRGALILLEQRERAGKPLTVAQLDHLLDLVSTFGFPRIPDDPCAEIFRFAGGGSYPTQYWLHHAGHEYYLRWRYGFSIDVDDETVLEGDLDTLTTNEWTFRETNVILAIVSAAIRAGRPLSELVFPDEPGLRAHPSYHPGRSPLYGFPDGLYDPERRLELRDRHRWYQLYDRRQRLVGIVPPPALRTWRCACGVAGLTCGVTGCDLPPDP